jgi:hypothetical protein
MLFIFMAYAPPSQELITTQRQSCVGCHRSRHHIRLAWQAFLNPTKGQHGGYQVIEWARGSALRGQILHEELKQTIRHVSLQAAF